MTQPEQRLAVLGRGLGDLYTDAAAGSEVFTENLGADVQGGNRIDQGSRRVLASERDTQETKGSGTLAAVGDVGEIANRGKRRGTAARRNFLSTGGLYDDANQGVINDQGSLRTGGDGVTPPADRRPTPPAQRDPDAAQVEVIQADTGSNAARMVMPTPQARVVSPVPLPLPAAVGETVEPREIPMPHIEAEVARLRLDGRPDRVPIAPRRHAPRHVRSGRRQVETVDDAFGMLNATAVTTTPGEVYGESLRGTPAEWLIDSQHRGVDLRIGEAGRPDPITSPWERAKVIEADHSKTLGNYMVVQSGNGDKYQFGHLDNDKGERMIGQTLKRGDVIGTEGTTGSSTGYHLDFRLLEEDDETKRVNRDPTAFYERFYNSVNAGQPEANTATPPSEMHVRVSGLESMHIQVDGLTSAAAATVKGHVEGIAGVVRSPKNHRGYG